MSDEIFNDAEESDAEAKPTITIAEKERDEEEADAKPTITIAEKDGGN